MIGNDTGPQRWRTLNKEQQNIKCKAGPVDPNTTRGLKWEFLKVDTVGAAKNKP
jgi:hypothetical protein